MTTTVGNENVLRLSLERYAPPPRPYVNRTVLYPDSPADIERRRAELEEANQAWLIQQAKARQARKEHLRRRCGQQG